MGMPKGVRADARAQIPALQGDRCVLCGLVLGPRKPSHIGGVHARGWNVDHVWPRARYAYEHRGNLLVAHTICNDRKGDRDPTGCERIMLDAVNARLGQRLVTRAEAEAARERARQKRERSKAERVAAHEARQAEFAEQAAARRLLKHAEFVFRKHGPDAPVYRSGLPARRMTRIRSIVLWRPAREAIP
jgi:hypothetical protein